MVDNNSLSLNKLIERLKQIKAKDIMTTDVITVKKDDPLTDVADLMIEKRISGFPVLEDGVIVGIITANDLFLVMDMIKTGEVLKINESDYYRFKVSFAMSTEVISVNPEGSLDEIISLMKYRNIHTLPVTFQNKLVGVIGRRDIFRSFYSAIKDLIL